MNGPDRLPTRLLLLSDMLASPAATPAALDPNRLLLASIIAGQASGEGCLPPHLGLGAAAFQHLCSTYFPGCDISSFTREVESIPEWEDLQKLLLDHRAREHPSELLITNILATACAGRDHLWQDLGLANRDELSRLMWINFPALARDNTGDMKWKKFAQCFGPEI